MNNEQRGVALLIVLMLLALMAALAADMTLSFHSQLQRTRQVNHHLQRQYDIELAEKLALASLTQDVKDNDRQTTLQQYWAQPQQLQLEDGNTVKWQLRDAQHCFIEKMGVTPSEALRLMLEYIADNERLPFKQTLLSDEDAELVEIVKERLRKPKPVRVTLDEL